MRRTALLACVALAACAGVLVPGLAAADNTVVCGAELGSGQSTTVSASDNVTLYHAPETELDSAAAIESSIENGTIQSDDEMIRGETLVAAIESERLAADLDERTGSTEERFFAALEGDANLRVVKPSMGACDPRVDVSITPENTTVYRSGATTYLVVDTGELTTSSGERLFDRTRLSIDFSYGTPAGINHDGDVDLYDERAAFIDLGETLPTAPVQIGVDENIEPERSTEIRLHLQGGETYTDVAGNATWDHGSGVAFDLSDVDPGTPYRLELVHDGDVVSTHTGRVTDLEATVEDVRATKIYGELAINATVRLSHGGTLEARDERGNRVGFAVRVQPNETTNVTIPLTDLGEDDDLVRLRPERRYVDGASYPGVEGVEFTVDNGTLVRSDDSDGSRTNATDGDAGTATDGNVTGSNRGNAAENSTENGSDGAAGDESTSGDHSLPGFGVLAAVVAVSALALSPRRRP